MRSNQVFVDLWLLMKDALASDDIASYADAFISTLINNDIDTELIKNLFSDDEEIISCLKNNDYIVEDWDNEYISDDIDWGYNDGYED